MDSRKHSSSAYRQGSGGTPVGDSRGGGVGPRSVGGGRNIVRGDRRIKERDGRDQRIRSGRGRMEYGNRDGSSNSSSLMMKTPIILARQDKHIADPPTLLPPGPGGVSIMQRESSGSHLPTSPMSHASIVTATSSSSSLFSPRGDPLPSPLGHHHHHAPTLPVSQVLKPHDERGRNHRKQEGVTSSPSSYTPLQPGMRGGGRGGDVGGGHLRNVAAEHSMFHSQSNEMTHSLKLIDRNLHWEDKGMEFLLEQSDYLVVGVLGKQGVGKSTLMSLLAGTRTGAPKPFMFRPQSKDMYENGGYQTAGVEMVVTAERVILLDSQPILSDTLYDQLCTNPTSVPHDMSPSIYLELMSLQMAIFLYSVCHVVLVVVDSLDSLDILFQFLWTAEQMKTSCLKLSVDTGELPDQGPGPKEYFSQIAFLLNHASPDHFQPFSLREAHLLLAENFQSAKFSINGGISLYKSGIVPIGIGFPVRKGPKSNDNIDPADVNFYLLPTNQNATDSFSVYSATKPENSDSNLNPVLKLLLSYTGHPSYTLLAETFRNQIFSMPRPPICRTSPQQQQQQQQLTEREWFEYARRIWITLKKSDLLSEYEHILEDTSPT